MTQMMDILRQLREALQETEKELVEIKDRLKTVSIITDSKEWFTFAEAAKLLDMEIPGRKDGKKFGRNSLIQYAKEIGMIRHNGEPYQKYIDNWCCKYYLKENKNSELVNIIPLLNIKGIDFLRRMIDEHINLNIL